jgi:hypothetical protein
VFSPFCRAHFSATKSHTFSAHMPASPAGAVMRAENANL